MGLAAYLRQINHVQEFSKALKQVDCPVKHDFAPGVYVRTMSMIIPEGEEELMVIGKTHKTEHFNFVKSGHCLVMMDGLIYDIRGPDMFVSKAGVKKLIMVLEDVEWATVHATEETDLDKLEAEHVLTDEEEKNMIEYMENCLLLEEEKQAVKKIEVH
jgi:hypothetical protein